MLANRKHTFSGEPIMVRKPSLVTSSYVLCTAHHPYGDIDIRDAKFATLWCGCAFVAAGYFQIKPTFVKEATWPAHTESQPGRGQHNLIEGAHFGANIYLNDLASTAGTGIVTSASNPFEAWMVGHWLVLHSGANAATGRFRITELNSAGSIDIDITGGDCTSGGNLTSGDGGISVEYVEGAIVTASGISTVTPSLIRLNATDIQGAGVTNTDDGGLITVTMPMPAANTMRIYVLGSGTLTSSSLMLEVSLEPAHSA